jgi:hypothetical protein
MATGIDHHPVTGPHNDSDPSMENSINKETQVENTLHLEDIKTVSRVPANSHYYEKDGLRTYGDNEDHEHEPPVSVICISDTRSCIDSLNS